MLTSQPPPTPLTKKTSNSTHNPNLDAVHLHDDVGVDLDPALAFDIVSMLKATSRVFQTVQWVAADNLSSEVYNQFDRVVVL